jgi:integrating conjugative element protein (TIGR03749 family)
MNIKRMTILWLGVLLTNVGMANDVEHVIWDKTPIHMTLPLNQERQIRFASPVNIIDSELDEHVDVMKLKDVLYITSHNTFTNKRLIVQLMPEGETIVLSLTTEKEATNTTPLEVLLSEKEHTETQEVQTLDFNAITLTRFAIQSLYSPERLLNTPPGINRTPMRTQKNINLVYGSSISARPLISWRGGDLYITAVQLKNDLNKDVEIDPRQFLGHWQTATLFPRNALEPRGKVVSP